MESATDLALDGVLCGQPALCTNALFSGLYRHLTLPNGYYSALHILGSKGSAESGQSR